MKLTFLGTGTSFGVPQLGCNCAVCKSPDPRDKRTRVGAVVESRSGTRILIDTPPELRLQLVSAGIDRVDAVLFTHDHADHTHGIDDLRPISVRRTGALPFYGSKETIDSLKAKFGYILDESIRPLPGTYKPEGSAHVIAAGQTFRVADMDVTSVQVPHGPKWSVFGYRIGPIGYVTDAKSVPDDVIAMLRGTQVLVLNALFRTEHPTHMSISEAVEVARKVGADALAHGCTGKGNDQFRIEFMGEVARFDGVSLANMAAEEGIADYVRLHATRPRAEALAFLARASMLVVLPQDSNLAIPAKLFDYMRYNAWLLAITNAGSATAGLLPGSAADVVTRDEANAIAEVIERRYAEFNAGMRPQPLAVDSRFTRRFQAERLFTAIEHLTGAPRMPSGEPELFAAAAS